MERFKAVTTASARIQHETRSIEDVLRAFYEQISSLGVAGFVCLFDEQGSHLSVPPASHPQKVPPGFEAFSDLHAEGFDLRLQDSPYLRDLLANNRTCASSRWLDILSPFLTPSQHKRLQQANRGSAFTAIFSPLKSMKGTEGIMIVFLPEKRESEDACDEVVFEALASHVGAAIENARLFSTLHHANLIVSASLDIKSVLQAIVRSSLVLLPDANDTHIFLYNPEGEGRLTFGAALWSGSTRDDQLASPRQNGLTYTVARSGKTIVIPDMRNHPLYKGVSDRPGWGNSIIGLPLKFGQRVVGVMNIAYKTPRQFSEEELGLIGLLGEQAAIAIENARLYEQAARERSHLRLLYEVGQVLAATLDPDKILDQAVRLTYQALGGLLGYAFLYKHREQRLSLRAKYGRDSYDTIALEKILNIKPGEGLAGWVLENEEAVIVPDVRQDSRWQVFPAVEKEVTSAMAAPIPGEVSPLGVMMVMHEQPSAFTGDHLLLFKGIAQQVSTALINAQRYGQVQNLVNMLVSEQDRLVGLVEGLPIGVILVDAEKRPVITNNLGKEILSLFHSGGQDSPIEQLGDLKVDTLLSRKDDPLPVDVQLKGGTNRVFEVQARQINMERLQYIITLQEVTRERENQARAQMQERLATVGQLAAGIAHDFNNIMAAILVYTDLLMRDMTLYPASRERLQIIREQVQRATSLIRQILDFSRRSVMEQTTLDLLPFLKELSKMLTRVLPENIHLDLTYEPGAYIVSADPIRLQQAFMNLALNSSDAMPNGGNLSIHLSTTTNRTDKPKEFELPPGDWLKITVADTGAGIPADVLPHIYEPFFTTKPAGQGTGLGLAQVYGIVKQHNGYIDVTSQPGEGAVFIVYLPFAAAPSIETHPSEPLPRHDGAQSLVLLAEDDNATRNALSALLEVNNYRVLKATNGQEALQLYQQNRDEVALVVSDMVMPVMGGVELYYALKEQWPAVKMLLITGFPLEPKDQALLEKGSVNWLQKPFSIKDFLNALQGLASQ